MIFCICFASLHYPPTLGGHMFCIFALSPHSWGSLKYHSLCSMRENFTFNNMPANFPNIKEPLLNFTESRTKLGFRFGGIKIEEGRVSFFLPQIYHDLTGRKLGPSMGQALKKWSTILSKYQGNSALTPKLNLLFFCSVQCAGAIRHTTLPLRRVK